MIDRSFVNRMLYRLIVFNGKLQKQGRLMFKIQITHQKLIDAVKTIPFFKRKVCILCFLVAATAFGARRVTTSIGNLPEHFDEARQTNTKHSKSAQKCYFPRSWDKLLDPNQEEFWYEGNHVPDAGFVKWATNPTPENAENYLKRMNAKRDRLHLMAKQQEDANKKLISEGIIANDYNFKVDSKASTDSQKRYQTNTISNQNETQIWLYFHPMCHHCKHQAKILSGLSNVFPVQTDGETLHSFEGLNQTSWAEEEDLERYLADGEVPVLILYNSKTNKITSLKGFQTHEQINRAISLIEREDG